MSIDQIALTECVISWLSRSFECTSMSCGQMLIAWVKDNEYCSAASISDSGGQRLVTGLIDNPCPCISYPCMPRCLAHPTHGPVFRCVDKVKAFRIRTSLQVSNGHVEKGFLPIAVVTHLVWWKCSVRIRTFSHARDLLANRSAFSDAISESFPGAGTARSLASNSVILHQATNPAR